MNNQSPLLQVAGLTKQFPGVLALDAVDLHLARGEVLAVIGENGAGKSTLMKILAGVHSADSGDIHLDGEPAHYASVRAAMDHGIALIHQELNLADNLDVASNIYLGREPHSRGLIQKKKLEQDSQVILDRLGVEFSPKTLVATLSPGHQQMVEIAKALSIDARILIMDEPTSSLSQGETENLYRVIRELRASGVSILYISHRLGEVRELADRVTVLRDGQNAGELAREEISHDNMVRLMVGRDSGEARKRPDREFGEIALRVEKLISPAHPRREINLTLRAGEIVGIAGLVGAGRTELLETLFGVTPALGGTIELNAQPIRIAKPMDAMKAGLALVPEDRKGQGLLLDMTVIENISLASLWRGKKGVFLDRAAEKSLGDRSINNLGIKTPSAQQITRLLSGGNQQKIVLGKWLALEPRVLLLDEPTRGIDVGAKDEIYRLMDVLAGQGLAVLFASSEMEEIITLPDRVLVMHDGEIAGELPHDQLNEEDIMRLATGAQLASKGTTS